MIDSDYRQKMRRRANAAKHHDPVKEMPPTCAANGATTARYHIEDGETFIEAMDGESPGLYSFAEAYDEISVTEIDSRRREIIDRWSIDDERFKRTGSREQIPFTAELIDMTAVYGINTATNFEGGVLRDEIEQPRIIFERLPSAD